MVDAMVSQEQFFEMVGYLKSMSARIKALHESVALMENNLNGFSSYVDQRKGSIISNLSDMRGEIGATKDSVKFLQTNTLLVINELKRAVKREDLDRIEKRLDLWRPERLVTRDAVKRLIERD